MKTKATPPLDPRSFISACRDLTSDCWLVKLFKVGPRTLQRWTAQRPYVDEDSIRENPLEKYEVLLKKLMRTPGGEDVARAMVARHADIVGCELTDCEGAQPDKPTTAEECLDDYPALVSFHEAIRQGESLDTVRYHYQNARRELSETYTSYQYDK